MHSTHRFFLSERSLYLVVIEARREDDDSVFAWLKTVRNRGGDSPVIVVINKCDDATHNPGLLPSPQGPSSPSSPSWPWLFGCRGTWARSACWSCSSESWTASRPAPAASAGLPPRRPVMASR